VARLAGCSRRGEVLLAVEPNDLLQVARDGPVIRPQKDRGLGEQPGLGRQAGRRRSTAWTVGDCCAPATSPAYAGFARFQSATSCGVVPWVLAGLSDSTGQVAPHARLGHLSVMITLDVYSHVAPTLQREAADLLGRVIDRRVVM